MIEGEPPTYGERVKATFVLRRSDIDYAREIDNTLGTGSINIALSFAIKLAKRLLDENREGSNILIEKSTGLVQQVKINTVVSDIEKWLQNPE